MELRESGTEIALDETLRLIDERDQRDANRAVGPLRAADDATCIDTSEITIDAVLEEMERILSGRCPQLRSLSDPQKP